MKEWIEVEIAELCELNPRLKNKEFISPELEVQFLPMALVEEVVNKIHLTETRKFSEVQQKSYTYFAEGDVLFAKVTPCMENGKIAIAKGLRNKFGFGSSEFHVFRPSKAIHESFLFYFLVRSKFRNEAQHEMTGAVGLRRVPKQFLENYHIPLPPLPEQRAIVARIEELFSELDHAVSSLQSAQAKLDIYRQAVLKKAFEGGYTEEWRKDKYLKSGESVLTIVEKEKVSRFDNELKQWENEIRLWNVSDKTGPKPIKPTQPKSIGKLSQAELRELPEIPSSWKWVKNNELLYYVTSGSRDWKQFYSENEGVFFIRTQDINTNKLNLENAAFVNLPSNVEGKRSLVEKGDLLMTITGANVGKVAAIDFDIPEAYVSQSVALMKYVLPKMAGFLHYYFQASSAGAKYVGAMVYGVGRPVLSLENIREAPVPLCSLEEQTQIVQEIESRLSVADKLAETIQTNLQKSEALRQSILKKAFEGRLLSEAELEACRKEADWEPAERLLERIKSEKKKK